MTDQGIDGFRYTSVDLGNGSAYSVGIAGAGSPILLLHGFPQDHSCWYRIAPALAQDHTVIVCDLKGVGESRAAAGGERGEGYSKREIAEELVQTMAQVGHRRFAVLGHDRGARVAYRMALDHPDEVERLAVLNIIPTVEQFERMTPDTALDYWPFLLLAQAPPFAERLLAADAEHVVRHIMATWSADPASIDPPAIERYVRAFTPDTISAWCAEYRAAFHLDRDIDAEDREAGRTIRCPLLVHWGAEEDAMSDGPLPIWRRWADDVHGGPIPSGHFIAEEAPDEVVMSLRGFLAP